MKAALRLGQLDEARRYLDEYYRLWGDKKKADKGLKSSMKNMNPLHGLSKEEQKQFLEWISQDDRKYLNRANAFFKRMTESLPKR